MSAALLAKSYPAARAAALPPLEALLVAGGDARLQIAAATGLNIYGCRPTPRPEALSFSSSTASSISEHAWRRAQDVWRRLAEGESHDFLVEEARGEFSRLFGLAGTGSAAVFAPSGTDAALHALAVAQAASARPLAAILCASDETGSGMPLAVRGHHFSHATARGSSVCAGEAIDGLGGHTLMPVPLRDRAGKARDPAEIDCEISVAAARAVASGHDVLLVAMDHSKLGNRAPSDACLAQIEAAFGERVRVVVDACQARLGLARLHAHLDRGRMLLLTGSKFFSGPPLSGALIVPPALAAGAAVLGGLPSGLRDYSIASDWPAAWTDARASLAAEDNPGPLLRWVAALAEIESWLAAPRMRRIDMLHRFAAGVRRAIAGYGALELLEPPESGDDEFPAPTIFPFFARHGGRHLSPEHCRALHRALNRDMRPHLPGLTPRERIIAALPCHIGQPVELRGPDGPRAVLRVSASARILGDDDRAIAGALARIFAKTELLLRHLDRIG